MLKKNIFSNFISQFYSIFIGTLILPLYINYLGAESYGLVGFFTMLMSWMMMLDIGLSSTLARQAAILKDTLKQKTELKILIRSVESIFVPIAIVVITSLILYSNLISSKWLKIETLSNDIVTQSIIMMSFMIIFKWFVGFYQGIVIGFEKQVWLNGYKIIFNTLKFVVAFLIIKFITPNIIFYFLYQLIIGFFELLIINRYVYKLMPKTSFLKPRLSPIKKILPFTLSIAYTSGIWIIFTQIDKLLLSNFLPLSDYGFYSLVIVISGAIINLTSPISQAFIPRMSNYFSKNDTKSVISLYDQQTKLGMIILSSISIMMAVYSYELIYAWSGSKEAALFAGPILKYYALGNGLLGLSSFLYNLQYVHGNLTYHVKINTVYPLITLPIMLYGVYNYGALGAAKAWFIIRIISFLIITPLIHNVFIKGYHLKWLKTNILPPFFLTLSYVFLIHYLHIPLITLSRLEIMFVLITLGIGLLSLHCFFIKEFRDLIKKNLYNR